MYAAWFPHAVNNAAAMERVAIQLCSVKLTAGSVRFMASQTKCHFLPTLVPVSGIVYDVNDQQHYRHFNQHSHNGCKSCT